MGNAPESMVDPDGMQFSAAAKMPSYFSILYRGMFPTAEMYLPGGALSGKRENPFDSKSWGGLSGSALQNYIAAQKNDVASMIMGSVFESSSFAGNIGKTSSSGDDSKEGDNKKNTPTESGGGFIDDYDKFYSFMVDKANTEKKEVAAWKLHDAETGKDLYFVMPWENNLIDQSDIFYGWLNQIGYKMEDIIADYHTHPGSTGPSYEDAQNRQSKNYNNYTIGADGRIWDVFNVPSDRPIGRYINMPGKDPNIYRYGSIIYIPKQ